MAEAGIQANHVCQILGGLLGAGALTSDYVESLPDASGDLSLSSFRGRMEKGILPLLF